MDRFTQNIFDQELARAGYIFPRTTRRNPPRGDRHQVGMSRNPCEQTPFTDPNREEVERLSSALPSPVEWPDISPPHSPISRFSPLPSDNEELFQRDSIRDVVIRSYPQVHPRNEVLSPTIEDSESQDHTEPLPQTFSYDRAIRQSLVDPRAEQPKPVTNPADIPLSKSEENLYHQLYDYVYQNSTPQERRERKIREFRENQPKTIRPHIATYKIPLPTEYEYPDVTDRRNLVIRAHEAANQTIQKPPSIHPIYDRTVEVAKRLKNIFLRVYQGANIREPDNDSSEEEAYWYAKYGTDEEWGWYERYRGNDSVPAQYGMQVYLEGSVPMITETTPQAPLRPPNNEIITQTTETINSQTFPRLENYGTTSTKPPAPARMRRSCYPCHAGKRTCDRQERIRNGFKCCSLCQSKASSIVTFETDFCHVDPRVSYAYGFEKYLGTDSRTKDIADGWQGKRLARQ